MEEPLGQAIGNSLEVEEAIAILDGCGEKALRHVCLFLGAQMLNMAGLESDVKVGYETLNALIKNKAALHKFKEFIISQGGNVDVVSNPKALQQAKIETKVICSEEGYIQKIDAAKLGYCTMRLGAGCEYKGQEIDLSAGIMLEKRVGDRIEKGQSLCTIYANMKQK